MTKMSINEMILFARDQREIFGGKMGDFLDNVIAVLQADCLQTIIVGRMIRKAMLEKGMNQRELARQTGLTEQAISRYIKGQRVPNVSATKKLADVLNVPFGYFYGINTESEDGTNE